MFFIIYEQTFFIQWNLFPIIGNIVAGFIGSWLGGLILGSWGPVIGGFAIIPAIIGSIVLVLIVSFILRKMGQNKNHGRHAK